jgi:TatD DNase family protein
VPGPVGDVVARAGASGVTRMITVGTDLPSSYWAVACAAGHDQVYAAVAIHPNDTGAVSGSVAEKEAVREEIAELAREPLVRAVGETGLDYYWDDAPPELQQEWFRAHIAIAKQAGKALMIHDRDAHDDVLRILDEEGPPDQVVFHCFSGDAAMAKRCVAAGFVLSFAGTLTFKNAQPLRDAAMVAPPESLLVETDAPFLTPVPNRGKSNSPVQVVHTLRALAAIKQLDVAELCGIIEATGQRVFGPW